MIPDTRPTPDLPDPSDLIAGLADGTLVIGGLAGHEIAAVVRELMRRNAELEEINDSLDADCCRMFNDAVQAMAERDALIRFYISRYQFVGDKQWSALVNPYGPGVAWTWHDSEAGAMEAVRKAVGLDKMEG